MSENNRLPARERYLRDAEFHALVVTMLQHIRNLDYTPTEMREAAMLACVIHEETRVFIEPIQDDSWPSEVKR